MLAQKIIVVWFLVFAGVMLQAGLQRMGFGVHGEDTLTAILDFVFAVLVGGAGVILLLSLKDKDAN